MLSEINLLWLTNPEILQNKGYLLISVVYSNTKPSDLVFSPKVLNAMYFSEMQSDMYLLTRKHLNGSIVIKNAEGDVIFQ